MKDELEKVELKTATGATVKVGIPRQCAEQIGQSLEMMQLSMPVSAPEPPPPMPPPLPAGH